MNNIRRIIQLPDINKHSVFLWGPRKVGKSYYIRECFGDLKRIDLLKNDVFLDYSSRPSLLREQLEHIEGQRKPIVIDEIQKVPALLDEVHWLIENTGQTFLLTGSSIRKLRRVSANMLGGRARRREMKPLCSAEVPDLEIEKVVISGLIPSHYLSNDPTEELRGYISDYVKEEIVAESEIRDLPSFSDFLRIAAISSAELINYANIGRESGVAARTVRDYFQILEDTLLGFRLAPWKKSKNRRLIETDKFYFFDTGVSNFLARRRPQIGTPEFGKSFEHFILMELVAFRAYVAPELEIYFWRTSHGQEVDFILGEREVAIEIKSSKRVNEFDTKTLRLLAEDGPIKRRILVSFEQDSKFYRDPYGKIECLHFREFLKQLWARAIV